MGCVQAKIGLTGQLDQCQPGNYFKPWNLSHIGPETEGLLFLIVQRWILSKKNADNCNANCYVTKNGAEKPSKVIDVYMAAILMHVLYF